MIGSHASEPGRKDQVTGQQAAVDLTEATDMLWLLGTSFVPAAYKALEEDSQIEST